MSIIKTHNVTLYGECWLQKMNIPEVIAMYPESTDVRRIDMTIGEREWWNMTQTIRPSSVPFL